MPSTAQDAADVAEKKNSFAEQSDALQNAERNPTCGDHLLFVMSRWSKFVSSKVSKNANSLLQKAKSSKSGSSRSKSKSKTASSRRSSSPEMIPESRKETLALGSAYLRRVDFSSLEPAVTPINMDNSAYFNELFSPPPELQSTLSVPIKKFKKIELNEPRGNMHLKKHAIRSKSLTLIL